MSSAATYNYNWLFNVRSFDDTFGHGDIPLATDSAGVNWAVVNDAIEVLIGLSSSSGVGEDDDRVCMR